MLTKKLNINRINKTKTDSIPWTKSKIVDKEKKTEPVTMCIFQSGVGGYCTADSRNIVPSCRTGTKLRNPLRNMHCPLTESKKHVLIIYTLHVLNLFSNFTRINNFKKKSVVNTKLTLTIEEEIILRAKKYAKKNGRSLSAIIENYLKIITKEETKEKIEITPLVKSMRGSFKTPKNYDYKKELSEGLSEKYL